MHKDETLERISKELCDYGWIAEEVVRLQQRLDAGDVRPVGLNSVESMLRRIASMRALVDRVDRAADFLNDKRERAVYEALKAGTNGTEIAKQIGVSRPWYHKIKRSMLLRLAGSVYASEIAVQDHREPEIQV
jgi:transposase-like protein